MSVIAQQGMVRRRKRRPGKSMWLTHTILLLGGLVWIYPFLWMLGSSLKTDQDFFSQGLSIFPGKTIAWGNYPAAWNEASFGQYFINTVIVSGLTVSFVLLFTSMAGYAISRTSFPGKKILLGLIAMTLFLPHGYTILPIFDLIQRLGLLNTLSAVIVVETGGGLIFPTFLFIGYFSSMDKEIEDAARVDGAGFNQRFWMIMFPLAGPMLATVALFTFIGAWNNFFIPLVFTLANPDLQTLAVGMYAFIGQNSTQWSYLTAGAVITLAPIMLVFIFLQRYFINGVAGAVKS
ncbi:sugar ABC transporter permease [Dictyobacter sp. S3.2.2.5]|uniref:Sugar ABC transporter permease n=1 Tax=Dictyobacter halimunensis TaxID=3026934 RepID=A0ABQ6FVQ2_9CHLR|nr:sugar ABC transporter permease [Dictyobacter sp. S3.2.2.5]